MENHAQRAEALFLQGYNCAQASFAAFCPDTGMDFNTALLVSSSFGGGMGRMREVCGALSGIFMAAGLLYGYKDASAHKEKSEHYARIQQLAQSFRQEFGSIICRDLLALPAGAQTPEPEQRTAGYYKRRPCRQCVAFAAGLLSDYIKQHPPEKQLNCKN